MRYLDNNNGTITDSWTGLMWQESYAYVETGNYLNWYNANGYVETLNNRSLGGYRDWRLPNRLEIQSLYEIDHRFESNRFLSLVTGVVFGPTRPVCPPRWGLSLMWAICTGIPRQAPWPPCVASALI